MIGTAGAGDASKERGRAEREPAGIAGRTTQGLAIFVDDVDAHAERARGAGATIFREPKTDDYGDDYWATERTARTDPEGHRWWFMQRVRDKARGE